MGLWEGGVLLVEGWEGGGMCKMDAVVEQIPCASTVLY